MKSKYSFIIKLFTIQCLSFICVSHKFDFFYFVQQWPGSYCDRKPSCCYPTSGKPATDFQIHGLWPNYNNGSHPPSVTLIIAMMKPRSQDLISSMQKNWPSLNCPSRNGTNFWAHEWNKHGTCSLSVLTQHQYFEAALQLKKSLGLLQILENSGIKPNGESYEIEKIREAIKDGTGFTPGIQCNKDISGVSQIYQVYVCVDASGKEFIECPVVPRGRCDSTFLFPSF